MCDINITHQHRERSHIHSLSTRFVRLAVASLLSLAFVASFSFSFVSAQPSSSSLTHFGPIAPTRRMQVALKGIVDLRKARAIQPGDKLSSFTPPLTDSMTPQQRATYEANARKGIGVPQAPAVTHTSQTGNSSLNPSFVGGGVIPLLVKNYEGLSSTQTGGAARPDPAIATDLSCVMEGVNGGVGIFRASTGALAYGPYTPDTFFARIKQSGDTFGSPQMYNDTMRDRWIVTYMEYRPSGQNLIDLAISQSNSPT
jgi:hypothetical protein